MQFLKRLKIGFKPLKTQERKVKPHIKLSKTFTNRFICEKLVTDIYGKHYVIGIGVTPAEAYEDWRRRYLNGEL